MTTVTARDGNVIYADFTPKAKQKTRKRIPSGVFIKPAGLDTTMWAIKGNVAGFIASYIAFHPEFKPSLFGKQVREELGVIVSNDDPEPPEAA